MLISRLPYLRPLPLLLRVYHLQPVIRPGKRTGVSAVAASLTPEWRRVVEAQAGGASELGEERPGYSEAELDAARKWLYSVGPETIPRDEIVITMSRSSGPGGQNVNKVNSKVTLRVPFSSIESRVPKIVSEQLKRHQWYAKKSDTMVISADGARSRKANQNDVFQKLEGLLRAMGKLMIPGKTPEQQRAKVEKLKRTEEEMRLREKKLQSRKKNDRRAWKD